jgi:hypothetical protein
LVVSILLHHLNSFSKILDLTWIYFHRYFLTLSNPHPVPSSFVRPTTPTLPRHHRTQGNALVLYVCMYIHTREQGQAADRRPPTAPVGLDFPLRQPETGCTQSNIPFCNHPNHPRPKTIGSSSNNNINSNSSTVRLCIPGSSPDRWDLGSSGDF